MRRYDQARAAAWTQTPPIVAAHIARAARQSRIGWQQLCRTAGQRRQADIPRDRPAPTAALVTHRDSRRTVPSVTGHRPIVEVRVAGVCLDSGIAVLLAG
jgi:hypothetical protein